MKSSAELEHEVSRLQAELAAERLRNQELQLQLDQQPVCPTRLKASAHWREFQELKARFVSITSHEFRTPLATIQATAETLENFMDRLTPQQQTQRFTKIREQVMRITAVLDDVLMIEHLEANTLDVKFQSFDLLNFLESIAYEFRKTYSRYILDYPCVENPLFIEADKALLHQVVVNLLSNAAKYSREGSRISLNLMHDAQRVELTVRDQGIGIPPEEAPYVFEIFHRAKNVTTIQGTGLGLSIVKRVVELHGGSIDFSSSLGQGTTFNVRLPLHQ